MGVCQNTKSNHKSEPKEKVSKDYYSKDNKADLGAEREKEAEERNRNRKNVQESKNENYQYNIIKSNQLAINNDVLISRNEINPEKIYHKEQILGNGAFGEVWLVKHKDLGKNFAMKLIKKKKINQKKKKKY